MCDASKLRSMECNCFEKCLTLCNRVSSICVYVYVLSRVLISMHCYTIEIGVDIPGGFGSILTICYQFVLTVCDFIDLNRC